MFKLSIKFKVLLILLLLTVVMIVGMSISMQIGFKKGFFDYRKALDKQFSDNVVLTLENYYQEQGSWEELESDNRLWHDLINQSSAELLNDGHFRKPPPREHQPPPRRGQKLSLIHI